MTVSSGGQLNVKKEKKALNIGANGNICQLITNTGLWKVRVGGESKKSNSTLIHSRELCLVLWAKQIRKEFVWRMTILDLPFMPASGQLEVDISPSSEMKVGRE